MMAFGRLATRFARDARGNTLAIVAAAIIPLAALVGSGVDMSRAYMAQARLQMACDAGALAGRRAMTTGSVDSTVRAEALKFFRFNFPTGESGVATPPYNVASFTPTVADGANSGVVMTASTTVPTTLMGMFGYANIPISVTCDARQDFVNTDIVLVLDTTGSMAQKAVSTDTQTKIEGLRAAVLALYDQLAPTQTQLQAVGLRLRYGIVPYSITVNAGAAIRALDPNYIRSSWTYQSRKANFVSTITSYNSSNSAPVDTVETYGSAISSSRCTKYGNNQSFSGFSPSPSGTPITSGSAPVAPSSGASPPPTTTTSYSFNSYNSSTQICKRNKSVVTTSYTPVYGYKFGSWTYMPATYDVSNFKSGNTITLATNTSGTMPGPGPYTTQEMASLGSGFSTSPYSWNGCVENADTDPTITSSTTSIPSGAHDLQVDEIPSSDATRYRPHWPDIVYTRASTVNASSGTLVTTTGSNLWACPAAAKALQTWDRTSLSNYVNTLNPNGYTYHDIGMMWGARFAVCGVGIFAANNPCTFNGMPVSTFIIYMTDGILDTEPTSYNAYGVEYLDQRVTGTYTTPSNLDSRHTQRFVLACNAARSFGANIWVIGFATSLSTQLTNCASKSSQASVSANSADLIAKFAEIGKDIGALRLTQ